jgi:3-oxoacyl-[acyl-carrier protein] reductase
LHDVEYKTLMAERDLDGKHALVTGASRGIGRAIAQALSGAGAAVTLNFRTRANEADALRRELERDGGRAIAVQADVSRRDNVERLVDEARRALGPIDIVINNAGVATPSAIDRVTEDEWDATVDINLKSAFLVTQTALPDMRARRWGRLVFVSSVAASVGGIVGPHYAASKAGMHGLMHYYAAHLAKERITANVVAPALIETDMIASNPNARRDLIPVGRFGTSEEVASLVLAIVRNGYLTGQVLHVNGGWYLT